MRILITEDEFIIALDMQMILEENGFIVIGICATGEEAVRLASEAKPDLILMDIVLQGKMDGVEAAKIISQNEQIPILFCTANNDKLTSSRLQNIRHVGVMNKPLEDKILVNSIVNFQSTFFYNRKAL
jgi:CheY-like chemotaxis protein